VKLIRIDVNHPPPVLLIQADFGVSADKVKEKTPIDVDKLPKDSSNSRKRKTTTAKGSRIAEDLPDTNGFMLDIRVDYGGAEYENVGGVLCSPGHFSPLIRYKERFYDPRLIKTILEGFPYTHEN
jgi:hypothetical protein